ncbi:MAG: hypothetical protein NTZ35_11500 [Ignavibacteriales bacterium]|nr:hypothetical protein [Ignavibacteriales bacterium]
MKLHGLPDEVVEHGTPNELYQMLKLDARGIAEVAKQLLESRQDTRATQLVTG